MILRRAAIVFLCLTSCNTAGSTRPVSHEESTLSRPANSLSDGSSIPDPVGTVAINGSSAAMGDGPTTERVVGYVAIIGGVIAITILTIGFYKLVRLMAH
jgi:hypothetical protein